MGGFPRGGWGFAPGLRFLYDATRDRKDGRHLPMLTFEGPLKVGSPARPYAIVPVHAAEAMTRGSRGEVEPPFDFDAIYAAWFDPVIRWLVTMGCPKGELEDVAQEVFIVVRRRLPSFDGGNVAGWVYRIAQRQMKDLRRRRWFQHLFRRPRTLDPDDLAAVYQTPADALEDKERRRVLAAVLARMSDKRREAFVLYELEGHSGEEIAAMLDVPVNTVWTRLHHARRDFFARVAELRTRRGET